MPALRVAEVVLAEEPPRLLRVVVRHCRLEVLALRRRLPQLPSQPAEEAHLRRFHPFSLPADLRDEPAPADDRGGAARPQPRTAR